MSDMESQLTYIFLKVVNNIGFKRWRSCDHPASPENNNKIQDNKSRPSTTGALRWLFSAVQWDPDF